MKLVCLDLEGVLVPEIWIALAESTGIGELQRTTRDEPDYEKLMAFRLRVLEKNNLTLFDIQKVIAGISPLPGAAEFLSELRTKTQVIILSDTFEQFAMPLMQKLNFPTLFCNTLECTQDGVIRGWRARQKNGKKEAVRAFKSCNFSVFAAGDSFNDIAMIEEAGCGCLFRASSAVRAAYPLLTTIGFYDDLQKAIANFLGA
ncbi:MAG: bifunctional phosphoserine phosphatase/homoserine phosphotransferase ThrH [Spirochaetaceae bacterium]|nr:bifunctional phosphoserine phosphatase/homoserine phosphotransferase ThrH [Spirochaetaceae bacterium]